MGFDDPLHPIVIVRIVVKLHTRFYAAIDQSRDGPVRRGPGVKLSDLGLPCMVRVSARYERSPIEHLKARIGAPSEPFL